MIHFLDGSLKIRGHGSVNIGRKVRIAKRLWLNFSGAGENIITIGDDCQINCAELVKIGDGALIANRVFIGNVDHNVQGDGSLSIKDRGERHLSDMEIGEGAFLGINSVILGCLIGKNAVVGALSFINKNISDGRVGLTNTQMGVNNDS